VSPLVVLVARSWGTMRPIMQTIRIAVSFVLLCAATATAAADPISATIPTAAYQDLRWRMIGPFRGGRTRAVSGVASQPSVF